MFKVVWDRESNGVRLTMAPKAGEALNVSPRPVFWEELDFLGLDKLGWTYPHSEAPLLWACNRQYFYRGELVLEVKGGNLFDKPQLNVLISDIALESVDINHLFKINEDSLFLIEHEALDFIDDTYKRYLSASLKSKDIDFQKLAKELEKKTKKEHVVVRQDCDSFDIMETTQAQKLGKESILNSNIEMFIASFSGGKDSEVLLDLVSRVIPASDFIVIYSDTGYELPTSIELFDEIQVYYKDKYPELRFYLAKNNQPVLYYWDELGSPSNIHRWCCGIMKTAPLYRKLKELARKGRQPHVLSFIGTRADESLRRSTYSKIAKDAKHINVVNVSPILDWSTIEIWIYILLHHLPFNKAYRMGLGRVGCVSCPFGSDWNDYLCNHLFPSTNAPFIDKLSQIASRNGVIDKDNYIGSGKWKIRAGGSGYETSSDLSIVGTMPDFKALLSSPKEDIYQWLKTLGDYTMKHDNDVTVCTIKYGDKVYNISLFYDKHKNTLLLEIPNVGEDIFFVSHLKRVLNKTTFCVHCELCEVECPTGALNVVGHVHIDENKCVHCKRCLDFKDNGCVTANSVKKAEGLKMGTNKNQKTTINRYNNFGFRDKWLQFYLGHYDTYFENKDHGLNVENQLPPFTNWLRDSGVLSLQSKEITLLGTKLAEVYPENPEIVWEILWINLSHNSEICSWYCANAEYLRTYPKEELEMLLETTLPQYSTSVRKNAFGALQNAFSNSPLGDTLGVGIVQKVKNKPVFNRQAHNDLSLVAAAYSLYKYAEKNSRYKLTVSEFYNPEQKEGIVRQFGIERKAFEAILRSLEQDRNQVLRSELKMGLDNIILREDLTSDDIIKLML